MEARFDGRAILCGAGRAWVVTFLRLAISGGALWTAYDEVLFADDCPGAAVGEERAHR